MLCAAAQLAGIGESIHTLIAAPFFIFGYGLGTFLAVASKRHLSRPVPMERKSH